MAGANKPDGKSNTQRVSFTRRDADRIGRVVRTVEAGDKKGNALTFRRPAVSVASGGTTTTTTLTTTTLTTTSIRVVTGVVLTTNNMTFSRADIAVVGVTSASSQIITVFNCPSNSVSSEGQAFFYG
jgi:hypothetical protein